MVHNARPPTTSHSSFLRSGASGVRRRNDVSGERKKNVLESCRGLSRVGAKLSERADTAHPAVRQQHETVANALGVRELVNGQHQGAAVRRHSTQQPHYLSGLPDIEAVE